MKRLGCDASIHFPTHAMKDFDRIERLRQEWSDKYVEADASVPALRRFAGRVGRVMTINMNGHALVQFAGSNDIGWYDVDLARLRIVAAPAHELKPTEGPAKPKAPPRDVVEASIANVRQASAEEAAKEFADETVDSLTVELAIQAVDPTGETTMSDDSVDSLAATEAPTKKQPISTADILAAARAAKAAKPEIAPRTESAAQGSAPLPAAPAKKLSTEEILAAARAKKEAAAARAPASEKKRPPALAGRPAAATPLSVEEILAEARRKKTPDDAAEPNEDRPLRRNTSDLSPDED